MTATITRQEARKELVADLRSGKFKQIRGRLGSKQGHCCLGVACEIAVRHGVTSANRDQNFYVYEGQSNLMPFSVLDFFGFATPDGLICAPESDIKSESILSGYRSSLAGEYRTLASMNDGGATFAEIADIIESEPKGLFVD
jgi:hypothetical protein